jgi:hypothetical protein
MYKKYSKKALSVLFAIALIVSLFAGLTINASATSGYWTESGNYDTSWYDNYLNETSYSLDTAAELAGVIVIVDGLNGHSQFSFSDRTINLTANVNLDAHYWTPVGQPTIASDATTSSPYVTGGTGFAGTFDGTGKTISGVSVSSTSKGVGLFGYLMYGGTIENLTVSGSVGSSGSDAIGGVVGYNSGTISNVVNRVAVTANSSYNVGGIAGFNNNYYGASHTGVITQCGNEGAISGGAKVGGIAGENSGAISYCYNYATIYNSGVTRGTGGIVGRNGNNNTAHEVGTITSCYNRGYANNNNVYWGGGIAGFNSSGCTITNCYDTADVYHCSYSNPLVGRQEGTVTADYCFSRDGVYASGTSYAEKGIVRTLANMQIPGFADLLNQGVAGDPWNWSNTLNSALPYLSWQTDLSGAASATDNVTGGSQSDPNQGSNTNHIILDGRFATDGYIDATTNNYCCKTLATAITEATAGTLPPGITDRTIYVTGPATIAAGTTAIGSNVTIKRDASFLDGYLFTVYGTLNMSTGTIDGNGQSANAQVLVQTGGTFNMSGGTITNAVGIYQPGPGVYITGGTFNLSGGSLTNMTGSGTYTKGAAVNLNSGEFNMTGGTISGNTSTANGGGVYVGGGTFTMTDGTITDNEAVNGGGIYAAGGTIDVYDNAAVTGNTATTHGGGLYHSGATIGANFNTGCFYSNLPVDEDIYPQI